MANLREEEKKDYDDFSKEQLEKKKIEALRREDYELAYEIREMILERFPKVK